MKTLTNILNITIGSIACIIAIILLTTDYAEQNLTMSMIIPSTGILFMTIGIQLLLKSSLFDDNKDIDTKYSELMTKYNDVVNEYINEMSENSELLCNVLEKEVIIVKLERQINTLEKEIEELRCNIIPNSDNIGLAEETDNILTLRSSKREYKDIIEDLKPEK